MGRPPPPTFLGVPPEQSPQLAFFRVIAAVGRINGVATLAGFSHKKFKYARLTETKESGHNEEVAVMRGFHCTHVGSQQECFPSLLPAFFPNRHPGILWTPIF